MRREALERLIFASFLFTILHARGAIPYIYLPSKNPRKGKTRMMSYFVRNKICVEQSRKSNWKWGLDEFTCCEIFRSFHHCYAEGCTVLEDTEKAYRCIVRMSVREFVRWRWQFGWIPQGILTWIHMRAHKWMLCDAIIQVLAFPIVIGWSRHHY